MDNSVVLLQYGFFSLFGAGQFLVEGLVVESTYFLRTGTYRLIKSPIVRQVI